MILPAYRSNPVNGAYAYPTSSPFLPSLQGESNLPALQPLNSLAWAFPSSQVSTTPGLLPNVGPAPTAPPQYAPGFGLSTPAPLAPPSPSEFNDQGSNIAGASGFNLPSPLQRNYFRPPSPVVQSVVSTTNAPTSAASTLPTQNALPVPGSVSQQTTGSTTTNVTTAAAENPNAVFGSGKVTQFGPTINQQYGPGAPPSASLLPKGQESAIPGTLYSPLTVPSGSVTETSPGGPGAGPAVANPLSATTGPLSTNASQYGGRSLNDIVNQALGNVHPQLANTIISDIGKGEMAVAPFLGPLAPFAYAGGALWQLISNLFPGADPRQVPASQIEQSFEATADNMLSLARNGYITKPQAQSAIQQLINTGNQYYESVPQLGKAGSKGTKNMDAVIGDVLTAVSDLPDTITSKPYDPSAAQALFIKGGKGWYEPSIQASQNLTNQFLTNLLGVALPSVPPVAGA